MAARKPTVTIKQVAEAAGVHFSTVSRALSPATRARVNPGIVARVLETAVRLGYRANTAASSLRTRRSHMVGLVVPDLASLLFPAILHGIEHTLQEQGYLTIVADTANDPERHRRILSAMIERQVDGLILASATLHDAVLDDWLDGPAPIVLINRTDDSGRAPAVLSDDLRGIGLAVEHLAGLGHARIGHVAGPQALSTGAMRRRGFAAAGLALGRRALPVEEAASFSREAGRAACAALLDAHPATTAIVAANDLLALGCYDALRASGRACPDDVSVTGYNDLPLMDLVDPPLTTVRFRHRDMGAEAARLLLARMAGQEMAGDVLLRPEMVLRGSTAPPPARQGGRETLAVNRPARPRIRR